MTVNNILIKDLSECKALMYDDGTICLFYSFPQEISVEDSLIRIGSMQVINRNEICDILRCDDLVYIHLKDNTVIQLKIDMSKIIC